jgi:hypothetical protein
MPCRQITKKNQGEPPHESPFKGNDLHVREPIELDSPDDDGDAGAVVPAAMTAPQ